MGSNHFYNGWTLKLINSLADGCNPEACKTLMCCCADYHYEHNKMDDQLERYENDIEGFIDFLTKEWGWIVTYDKAANVIIADENKADCICPVVHQAGKDKISSVICHCSEGFAEKMFSKIVGKPVRARVIRSILRGDTSCVYELKLCR